MPTRKVSNPPNVGVASSRHTVILVSVLLLLALTLVNLILTLSNQKQRLTITEAASLCSQQVNAAVIGGVDAVTNACRQTETVSGKVVPPTEPVTVTSEAVNNDLTDVTSETSVNDTVTE